MKGPAIPEAMPETVQAPEPIDWVVGLDTSLTGTGMAILGEAGIRTHLFKSTGDEDASLAERSDRLNDITNSILQCIPSGTLIVIEGPSYGSMGGSKHDRSGLWWLVITALHPYHRIVEVAPSNLKKYATGNGKAGKDEMLAAAIRRYPNAEVTNNNVADAVHLAAMGARHLGHPQETDTVKITEAMEVPRWNA